jgi:hypothetical protein
MAALAIAHPVAVRPGKRMPKRGGLRVIPDPAEAARIAAANDANPAKWGINREALSLVANKGVKADRKAPRNAPRSRRFDWCALLVQRRVLEPSHVACVDRLVADIAERFALGGSGEAGEKVDCVSAPHKRSGINDARLFALERIEAVLMMTGPASARLLLALCEPAATRGDGALKDYRAVVRRQTGEIDAKRQIGHIRAACDNLREAYDSIDRRSPFSSHNGWVKADGTKMTEAECAEADSIVRRDLR